MAKNGLDRFRFLQNGEEVNAPVEKSELLFNAIFQNDVQPSLDITELTLTNQSNASAVKWKDDGRIFEAQPYKIELSNSTSSKRVFNGQLNLADEWQIINPVKSQAKLLPSDGKQALIDLFSSLTVAYFEEEGVFTNADYQSVPFVVETRRNFIEIATPLLIIYLMGKEVDEALFRVEKAIADVAQAAAQLPNGSIVAVIYQAAILLVELAYTAAMIIILISLALDQIENFFPPLREHKCISLRKLIEKPLNNLGIQLETNLPLNTLFYLPSNRQQQDESPVITFAIPPKEIKKGLPRITDFGYAMGEVLDLLRTIFNADFTLRNGVCYLYNEDDPFWVKDSTLTQPPVLTEAYRYNTEELVANFLTEFATDLSDDWTIDNWKGTNFQVITEPDSLLAPRNNQVKGLETVSIPLALGSRKDELNNFERVFLEAVQLIEGVISLFGGNDKFSDRIKARVGALRTSTAFHSVPKLLLLRNGSLPSNHRDLLNAKNIYQSYYRNRSFISNGFKRQRQVFEGIRFRFTYEDFLKAIDNSYFTTSDGRQGKFTNLEYNPDGDYCVASYWIENIYCTNLKETFVEPQ